jgi:uncharacterized protein (DUF2384 family)
MPRQARILYKRLYRFQNILSTAASIEAKRVSDSIRCASSKENSHPQFSWGIAPASHPGDVLESNSVRCEDGTMSTMSEEDRLELTRGILNMLDEWQIDPKDQLALLGLENVPAREVNRLRDSRPLPDEPDVMQRVEHLISIADALRTTYPFSKRMGRLWMHKPNRKFRQRTPVATMVEDGIVGLVSVRSYLDCSYSWDISGSKT